MTSMSRKELLKYSIQLTLDPSTAHESLSLLEENKIATRGGEQPHYNHSEKCATWPKVLCKESLTGCCYWEVECKGDVRIGVTYKKKGCSDESWSLCCHPDSYFVWENGEKPYNVLDQPLGSRKVGVHLDWGAGALSFYRVSSDVPTNLYPFTSSFTEPLYPGFWLNSGSSVSLVPMPNKGWCTVI